MLFTFCILDCYKTVFLEF